MATVGSALGAAVPQRTITHDGRTYTVGLLTQAVKAAFEEWLAEPYLATIQKMAHLLPPERVMDLIREAAAEASSSKYSFYGPLALEKMGTVEGGLKLASLLLGCDEQEAVSLMAARGDEVRLLLEVAVAKSLPREQVQAAAVPNG